MSHEGSRGGGVPGAPGLDERLVIEVPGELVEKLDDVVDLLGFKSREEFARARAAHAVQAIPTKKMEIK